MVIEKDVLANGLLEAIVSRRATVGIIGLGYVGLPLAMAVAGAGFRVVGFDIDQVKIELLNAGRSYIEAVPTALLADQLDSGRFRASCDFSELATCNVIIICVPTPLTKHREPDLTFVENTARLIAERLKAGQLVVLESTTYPGTTEGVLRPILEVRGLKSGVDFFVGYSPEREDPGNREFAVKTIPKVVAGDGLQATRLVEAFYSRVVNSVVVVKTTATAEAVKLTENIFRSVNIALVNELKVIYGAMGIDVWEVIEAAKTKPFGYMPFYPGPGLGGHCVPIDPFYLSWKARGFDVPTRFIELAGEINSVMPQYVVGRLADALNLRFGKALSQSQILIIGIAYKKNVPDTRESPSLKLIELIEEKGGVAEFHDPHVSEVPATRGHMNLKSRRSVPLEDATMRAFDAVVIATDHDRIDYSRIAASAQLVIDTRNVIAKLGLAGENLVKA